MRIKLPIKKLMISFITLSVISAFISGEPAKALVVDESCKTVETIFARGSGEGDAEDDESKRFTEQLRLRTEHDSVTFGSYPLGKEAYDGHQYPHVPVGFMHPINSIGASLTADGAYGRSVSEGIAEFKSYIAKRAAKCTTARFVLSGYSQGAQVIGQALPQIDSSIRNRIDFVGLFGDPKLYLPEGEGFNPPACQGKNYSVYRRDIRECNTDNGSLGARKPDYLPSGMGAKTGLWCASHDFVCGTSKFFWDTSGHMTYKEEGGSIDKAAREAAEKIKASLPSSVGGLINTTLALKTGTAGLDTVFVIDTTGSMTSRINQAKEFARQSAAKVKENNGRVALVAYRDAGDSYTAQIMSGLQSDQTDFLAKLNGLQADGGGDLPEALLHALTTAFNGLSWKNGATKAAVVLTDAGFHDPDHVDGSTINSVVKRSLEIDPVNVYPVVPSFLTTSYQDLASRTTGQVIEDSGDTVTALTTALTKIINRPVALLKNNEYLAASGQSIHFDASDSYVIDATITGYDWDFNGDGIYDQHTTGPTVDYTYPGDFDGTMQVRVSADNNTIASASATVKVGAPAEAAKPVLPAIPNNFKVTASSSTATTATLSWNQSDGKADKWLIAVNDVPAGTVEKTRTSLPVTDLDRSADITFAIAGVAADGTVGNYAIVTLPKTPTSPCGTSNSAADQYCRWSWSMQQQWQQWQQAAIQQYYATLRPY